MKRETLKKGNELIERYEALYEGIENYQSSAETKELLDNPNHPCKRMFAINLSESDADELQKKIKSFVTAKRTQLLNEFVKLK